MSEAVNGLIGVLVVALYLDLSAIYLEFRNPITEFCEPYPNYRYRRFYILDGIFLHGAILGNVIHFFIFLLTEDMED